MLSKQNISKSTYCAT